MRRDLALFLALGCAALLAPCSSRAQVSPGPLAASHAEWDGTLQCFQCHDRGGKASMDGRCLACHTEVAAMKTSHRGYHARVTEACAKCHPDHAGRGFQMIAWEGGKPEAFDHARAGWPLEGKHAAVECRACHKPTFQRSPVARSIRVKDRARSWLGLEQACASCHEDVHRGQLGLACQSCHDLRGWKLAPRFDHAKSRYPLTGKHADVACAKCHLAPGLALAHDAKGAPVPLYKPLPFAECSACHVDPHKARFGGKCASCHLTESWKRVNERGFDHDRTRYPLRGKHVAVTCAGCHDPKKAWGAKPAFATCGACHRDAHNGLATIATRPADCAACHDVRGYRPSTFTVAQHRATRYPLDGAHALARCAGCHPQQPAAAAAALGPARTLMRPPYGACVDCHADPHRGRFSPGGARAVAAGCLGCHGMMAFGPSSVDVAAHAKMGFALEGAHRATPCQACHKELEAPPPASSLRAAATNGRPLLLADAPSRCDACHPTPHGTQFAARRDRGACEACHGVAAWAPAPRFDHTRDSAFRLDGRHARVPCAGCHPTERSADGRRRVVYRPVPVRCESCHTDAAGTSLRGARSTPAGASPRGALPVPVRGGTLAAMSMEVAHAPSH